MKTAIYVMALTATLQPMLYILEAEIARDEKLSAVITTQACLKLRLTLV